MSVFKACDIRGVVGEELDEPLFRRLGRSLGAMVRRRASGPVCLGGDFRRSTPALKQAVQAGLLDAGANVIDVGQTATPMVYFAARHLGCSNVAIVTASHNAGQYNGLKFMVAGEPAVPELIRELRTGVADTKPDADELYRPVEGPARVQVRNVREEYEAAARADAALLVPGPTRRLRIAIDTMHGAMSGLAARVLQADGFEVLAINDRIDPDFAAGSPNPAVDRCLQPLIEHVRAEGANVGLALDGDGDRVAFVDHRGTVVRPEQVGALLVQHVFDRPTVVYDQKCASVLAAAVQAAGGRAIMQPSGYGFIKRTMIAERAHLGVEVSGHYFFELLAGSDDGLFAGLVIARLVAASGQPMADLIAPIGWPAITPDLRIAVDSPAEEILEQLAVSCGGQVSRLDGVRAEYDDGWALARASITEPVMTFRFEGRDVEHVRRIAGQFLAAVPDVAERVLETLHG